MKGGTEVVEAARAASRRPPVVAGATAAAVLDGRGFPVVGRGRSEKIPWGQAVVVVVVVVAAVGNPEKRSKSFVLPTVEVNRTAEVAIGSSQEVLVVVVLASDLGSPAPFASSTVRHWKETESPRRRKSMRMMPRTAT